MEKAIETYDAALTISREIGDQRGEGSRLGNLGSAYLKVGDASKAISNSEMALKICREIGDRRNEAANLGNLGLAYAALGQVEKARSFLYQALAIFEEIRSPGAAQARHYLDELSAEGDP